MFTKLTIIILQYTLKSRCTPKTNTMFCQLYLNLKKKNEGQTCSRGRANSNAKMLRWDYVWIKEKQSWGR